MSDSESGAPRPDTPRAGGTGIQAITGQSFSLEDAVGGWRGVIESVAPGLLFVVVFVAGGQRLAPALIAAAACALIAMVIRLVQRSSMTQAFSGIIGVGIGVLWAWRTGRAEDYFLWGLLTNVGYLAAFLISVLVRWPLVGLVIGLFRPEGPLNEEGTWGGAVAWRQDSLLRRRYLAVSWLWCGMFAARLVVQVPLYLAGQVGWLGTAKLVMGVPLTAVVLWLSWVLLRGTAAVWPDPAPTPPDQ